MAKPGGGVGSAGGKAAGGIFAKHAGELFRVKGKGDNVIRLDPEKIGKETREKWRDQRRSRVPDPDTKVNSRKVDLADRDNMSPQDRELVDAVESARRELGDEGGRNYAAIRYLDTDGQERILVTRSDGVHSERMGGNYLLDRMGAENIRAVYTERSPCNINPSYCDEWMKAHIPNADVSHAVNYGIEGNTRAEGNREHRGYRRGLFS